MHIFLLFFPIDLIFAQIQPLIPPNSCSKNNESTFFNTLLYKCESCPNSQISENGLNCDCDKESVLINGSCIKCGIDQIKSPDGLFCVECRGVRCGCDLTSIITYRIDGQPLSKVKCTKCLNGTMPDESGRICVGCESFECQCANSSCSNNHWNSNIGVARSQYIEKLLPKATFGCQRKDLNSCQILLNLCTLQNFAFSTETSCGIYGDLASSTMRNQIPALPLSLPYPTAKTLGSPLNFFKFDSTDNGRFSIFVATIFSNGSLKSWKQIEISGLFPSTFNSANLHKAFTFGVQFSLQKQIEIEEAAGNDGLFYEMFLKIPKNVKNENLTFEENMIPIFIASSLVNQDLSTQTSLQIIEQWILTKRFFMYDSKSMSAENSSSLIRRVTLMDFTIFLENSRDGKIGIPIVKVFYSTFQAIDVEAFQLPFSLKITYFQDPFRHDRDMEITIWVMTVFGVVWAAIRGYSWAKRSGKQLVDVNTLSQFFGFLCDSLGNIFLLVITAMACWLTFAYKSQTFVYYRLLMPSQESTMMIYIYVATILKSIAFIHNRLSLVKTKTFFIDWEKPKIVADLSKNQPTSRDLTKDRLIFPSVIWRTYLVANEWNELQNYRKTSVALQMVIMPFILEYLGWMNFAIIQPGFSAETPPEGFLTAKVTRWAVSMFIYLTIVFLQWAISVLVIERIIIDPFHNFIDLCSVANISVFSLTHSNHGYYIHGRSIHGRADTNMREMNEFLQRERDNMCGFRGLETNSELQTYSLNLPSAFGQKLDEIKKTASMPYNGLRAAGQDPATVKMSALSRTHEQMNAFLIEVIDRSANGIDYTYRDQAFIEALFDLELDETSQRGSFVRDPSETGFSVCFSYGHEWSAVSLEALLYCASYLFFDSLVFSSFFVFTIYFLLSKVFSSLFTSNLVQSSCVDHRFLI